MLDEVLYELDDDEDTELCLVDEVVEMFDSAADGPEVIVTPASSTSVTLRQSPPGRTSPSYPRTR